MPVGTSEAMCSVRIPRSPRRGHRAPPLIYRKALGRRRATMNLPAPKIPGATHQEVVMSQLKRHDPFAIEPVGDIFQGLLRSFRGNMDGALPFKVDVTESDKAYSVVAEIPGAKKEDIDVTVDRGTVMISAKVERSSEEKEGERIIRSERYSGSMQRMFTLDAAVDESKVDATYENGLLRVTLPKKEASPQQRVTIR